MDAVLGLNFSQFDRLIGPLGALHRWNGRDEGTAELGERHVSAYGWGFTASGRATSAKWCRI